jgi:hypothetical protein
MPLSFHAVAPLEVLPCVRPMPFISGVHCLLLVGTVNCVETLKATATQIATLTLTLAINSVQALDAAGPNMLASILLSNHGFCHAPLNGLKAAGPNMFASILSVNQRNTGTGNGGASAATLARGAARLTHPPLNNEHQQHQHQHQQQMAVGVFGNGAAAAAKRQRMEADHSQTVLHDMHGARFSAGIYTRGCH